MPIVHYINDSSSDQWRQEMRAMWSEGETSPVQADPPAEVFDVRTPMLLRRQAA
jgi:hypothetical protein